jgi:hypothetical protein
MALKKIPLFSEGQLFSWPFHPDEASYLLSEFVSCDLITRSWDFKLTTNFIPTQKEEEEQEEDFYDVKEMIDILARMEWIEEEQDVKTLTTMLEEVSFLKWEGGLLRKRFFAILKQWDEGLNENEKKVVQAAPKFPTDSNYNIKAFFSKTFSSGSEVGEDKNKIASFIYFVKESHSLELVILSALVNLLEQPKDEDQPEEYRVFPAPKIETFLPLLFYPQVGEHVSLISKNHQEELQPLDGPGRLDYEPFVSVVEDLLREDRGVRSAIKDGIEFKDPTSPINLRERSDSAKSVLLLTGLSEKEADEKVAGWKEEEEKGEKDEKDVILNLLHQFLAQKLKEQKNTFYSDLKSKNSTEQSPSSITGQVEEAGSTSGDP